MPGFTRGSYKAKAIMKRRGGLRGREEVCSCRSVRETEKSGKRDRRKGEAGKNESHHSANADGGKHAKILLTTGFK